jgi:hypothetical protein
MFSEIIKFICTYPTIPVSTAAADVPFRTLRRHKTMFQIVSQKRQNCKFIQ